MAVNTKPIFVVQWTSASTIIVTANTNLNGTGTIATLYTAGASGALFYKLIVKARVTTTAGMIRLYIDKGAGFVIFDEIVVPAITSSGTAPSFMNQVSYDFNLESGDILGVSTNNAESFAVTGFFGEYE